MPYFDRIDICEAHYLFASRYHSGRWSRLYLKLGQLSNMGFRPSPLLGKKKHLSENGQEIYRCLVKRYRKGEYR